VKLDGCPFPDSSEVGENNVNHANRTLKQKAYQGLKEYLAISFYLWLVFGLFVLYKSVLLSELSEQRFSLVAHGVALFNALALAKVMLVAQELHFADYFKEKPLIYPTLFKSVAFAIVLGCFKILEEGGVGWYHHKSFSESITEIGGGTLWGILVLMAILAVLLIPFFGFSELRGIFGEDKLQKLFFISRDLSDASS
jgi:hypothetical protein